MGFLRGLALTFGVIFLVVGLLGVVVGGLVLAFGPGFVEDESDRRREENPLSAFSGQDEREEDRAKDGVAAGGALVLGVGGVLAVVGLIVTILAARRKPQAPVVAYYAAPGYPAYPPPQAGAYPPRSPEAPATREASPRERFRL